MQDPYIPFKIIQIRSETANTKSFVLEQLTGKAIEYKPGQFLTLVFRKEFTEDRRSFSISSTAVLNEPLTITIKRVDNGEYSRYMFDTVKAGDILLSIGASGYFTLPGDVTAFGRFFFLAAGSGITPILPLIKTLLYTSTVSHIDLIYSNKTNEESIFLQEIHDLQKRFSARLQVQFLLSSSQNLMKARLTKSLLSEIVHEIENKLQALFYICGPAQYMQMATITLLAAGIPRENIRKENFSTEKPTVREQPPDVNPHIVKIKLGADTYQISVQYPFTILEAAKRSGIVLPYSCEAGKCGTCSATCIQGSVWHSYNEVLLDRELDNGRILTCTGYPYGREDVVIVFPDQQGK